MYVSKIVIFSVFLQQIFYSKAKEKQNLQILTRYCDSKENNKFIKTIKESTIFMTSVYKTLYNTVKVTSGKKVLVRQKIIF